MRYLTRKASKMYFELSRLSYISDLVGWTHFLDRMGVLKDITRPKDPVHVRAERILGIEEWPSNYQWAEEEDDENPQAAGRVIYQKEVIDEDGEENEVYLFIVGIPGLQAWRFNQYDDDFFPSIPHGHWEGKKSRKLDSYLGWVYERSKQISRERRSMIVKLWNDDGFRRFASTAIDYYLNQYPHYSGWRVANPRRLPRKR